MAANMSRDSDRSLPYHLIYVAEACRLLSWLTEYRISRLHAHFGTNSAEVVMFAHALGGPLIVSPCMGPTNF